MNLPLRSALSVACVVSVVGTIHAADPAFPEPHAAGEGLTVTFGASNFAPGTPREGVETFYTNASVDVWRSLGVTSWESYVRWSGFEPEPGRWDFSMYDAECDILDRHSLKWVPFLLIGMNYATPDWYQKSNKNVYYKCLEHNEYSGVQSIWNPDLPAQVKRVISAFAEHYRDRGVIESVLLGITGDFGEAIYPVTGGGWTGDYHQHQGYWCGDDYAKADFRAWLKARYKTVDRLSAAWGNSYETFDHINPFLLKDAPSEQAWLDFVEWYRNSMNRWIDLWMKTTREAFPETFIYLCTGGHAPPSHGSHFGEQARLAAKYGGGIRITNEASDYPKNFWLTRWVASAGSFYGAPYSFEPAGMVDINGIIRRIYGVTASSAQGLFEYSGNIFSKPEHPKRFYDTIEFFQPHERCVDIAVMIPNTWLDICGDKPYGAYFNSLEPLRDRFDFDFVDEDMLARGAADRYRVLTIVSGTIFETSTFEHLRAYAERGGIVIATNDGEYRAPQGGETQSLPKLFSEMKNNVPASKKIGKGGTIQLPLKYDPEQGPMIDSLVEAIIEPGKILDGAQNGPHLDGNADGVYVTLARDALLLLNTTDEDVIVHPKWEPQNVARFNIKAKPPEPANIPAQSVLKVPLR
ncbi:MAG: beta-galactosidase [bacterium]